MSATWGDQGQKPALCLPSEKGSVPEYLYTSNDFLIRIKYNSGKKTDARLGREKKSYFPEVLQQSFAQSDTMSLMETRQIRTFDEILWEN